MDGFIVIYVTAGSAQEAEQVAQTLVGEKLAACVNRIKSVRSVYRWQGQVEQSDEELLIIKTRKELFGAGKKSARNAQLFRSRNYRSPDYRRELRLSGLVARSGPATCRRAMIMSVP